MRSLFIKLLISFFSIIVLLSYFVSIHILWSFIFFGPIMLLGIRDLFQTKRAILRNFPVIGHFRYFLEEIRPEIRQYFIESDTEGVPFGRDQRSLVYQRAKKQRDTVPFGTVHDVYKVGYEWVNHSLSPIHLELKDMRIKIGGDECKQPYFASLLNISAMSFGSLSKNAVLSLSNGAKLGKFAHNTGEGGISPYHIEGGADLIWQIGTGYFGCRTEDGHFDEKLYAERSGMDNVKMIELKLSQGAKPGHGGILPAAKVTKEISMIRNVPMGKDVLSPPSHNSFSTPEGLLKFISKLRELSGGKPVGFKLCVGKRREFLSICKAMIKTNICPDFITVDGGEGGTGAAPLEFSNHIGAPLIESLIFVHNALIGYGLRGKIKLIASGKITSAFGMVKRLALGADLCYSARAMMMAVGCIQARKCNANDCPVGVATQDKDLQKGLVVENKKERVKNFHFEILKNLCEIIGAMGIRHPEDLKPWHIMRRTTSNQIKHYGELYEFLNDGDLLKENLPKSYERACNAASAEFFSHVTDVQAVKN